ncbi:hypothetical protein ACFYZ3_08870 [Streptomyces sp. NPDC001599]|uniref:hypothetical protein n=1 Tax=Streptomyces sp. NPDC001599 TaxID=3364591 RepID=UPI0036C17900
MSQRVTDLAQLVVSELVAGPIVVTLRITGESVEVSMWDSDPVLPVARAADAYRVGQHGIEIIMAVARSFMASSIAALGLAPPVPITRTAVDRRCSVIAMFVPITWVVSQYDRPIGPCATP